MTKVMILSDSFKQSASSKEVGYWIKESLLEMDKTMSVDVYPFADGGEGTLEALLSIFNGESSTLVVKDMFLEPKPVNYGTAQKNIFIESAEVIGLEKVEEEKLDPWKASSFGLGELLKKTILIHHPDTIYLGIGGTAINDGGIGFLQGIGAKILDKNDRNVSSGIRGLKEVVSIDLSKIDSKIMSTKIVVLSDVQNPICGKKGATLVFGSQKGIKQEESIEVDAYMQRYSQLLNKVTNQKLDTLLGAGAAGGLGMALHALPNVIFKSGAETLLQMNHMKERLKEYDLVITGEGRIDNQSQLGKVPVGIGRLTKQYCVPLIAIVGSQSYEQEKNYQEGIDLIIDIINEPMTLQEAKNNVEKLVKKAAKQAYHVFSMIKRYG